jgi:hypothetical protein
VFSPDTSTCRPTNIDRSCRACKEPPLPPSIPLKTDLLWFVLHQDLHHFLGLVDLALKNRGEIGNFVAKKLCQTCVFSFSCLKDFVI